MDINNEAQKWLSFDSSLNRLAAKKLVTPDAVKIIGQSYIPSNNSIIRIDQLVIDDEFRVRAFVFDVHGNIINQKDIDLAAAAKARLLAVPFYVIQSPNQQMASLVQMQMMPSDTLLVTAFSMDNELATQTSKAFKIPFNKELQDVLMPLTDNKGSVYVLTTDKFDSYTLSTSLHCFKVSGHDQVPQKIQFHFNRKKVKDLHFSITDSRLLLSALYNENGNKKDVAGMLYAGFDLSTGQLLPTTTQHFDQNIKDQLKRQFGNERHKGHLPNYMVTLPHPSVIKSLTSYAILLPPYEFNRAAPPRKIIPGNDDINDIKNQLNYVNSFVGAQPSGYSRPMDYVEARAYAETRNPGTSHAQNQQYQIGANQEKYKGPKSRGLNNSFKNLLLLGADGKIAFSTIHPSQDPAYRFYAYFPVDEQFGRLYYKAPLKGMTTLQLIIMDTSGIVKEKKVYEDQQRILVPSYPYSIYHNSLVAFFEDKTTGEMGLVKMRL
jgi:hypothetical protein